MAGERRGRPSFSRREWIGLGLVVALCVTLAWVWASSLVPNPVSVMAMGYPDPGGGPPLQHAHGPSQPVGGARGVDTLTVDPDRPADVSVDLIARAQRVTLAGGRVIVGYTINGTTPGPTIRARQGQLVQVRVTNQSVDDGITLHWHGVDVPNAEDGVAGVTQDAVLVGDEHIYRFMAKDAGTYWYHSHQMSHEQVQQGLLGALVIDPPADAAGSPPEADVIALAHIYDGKRTVNGLDDVAREPLAPGATARVRVINTDNGPMSVWVSGGPFRVVAVDGRDLHEPDPVLNASVLVTAGGRADLEVTAPADGTSIRVELGGSAALVLGGDPGAPTTARTPQPEQVVDLLTYGSPADLGEVGSAPTRQFEYSIGRRPGLVDGRPGLWWTVNGHLYPDVPMFLVSEGDVVRMRISNSSGDVHPMHLHGHHAVVLSRNGAAASGSPWWVDSLNVADGETYEIAFVADNPGIWMDHCHNLPHAAQGLVAHLAYEGVTTPFLLGGEAENHPE